MPCIQLIIQESLTKYIHNTKERGFLMLVHASLTCKIPVTGVIDIPDDVINKGSDAINRYIEENKEDVILSKKYKHLYFSQADLSPINGCYDILPSLTIRQLAELENTSIIIADNSIIAFDEIFLGSASYSVIEYTVEDIVVGYGFFAKGFTPEAHTRNILATQPAYHSILKGKLEVQYTNDTTSRSVVFDFPLPPDFPDDWYILCYTDEGYNRSIIVGVEIIAKSAAVYEDMPHLTSKIKDYKLDSYICTNCGATNVIDNDGTNIVYVCSSCGQASTFTSKYK